MHPWSRLLVLSALCLKTIAGHAADAGSPDRGKIFFQQSCAICHADSRGAGNVAVTKQGPSLVGVFGRRAATGESFTYSQALQKSGLTWEAGNLDRFLENPAATVPDTTMPLAVADSGNRADVIAYLSTLKTTAAASAAPAVSQGDAGDWRNARPGVKYRIEAADLAVPYSTKSAGNGPRIVKQPADAALAVPPGFTVRLFADGLSNPRLTRTAPNGDIFIAETGRNRIRVLRAPDGAEVPTENEVFAGGLRQPFGIAFYPSGDKPEWIYVANNDSVVRIPYQSGDLKATGDAQVVVPHLPAGGGHSTRDLAFSRDGKRMFISVGSTSNVAESMSRKNGDDLKKWEAEHGRGAAWDSETQRADILVTDPEGTQPLRSFATGVRNGVGLAVDPETGELWTSTNERDGLGDNLVPDYVTHVKEGGYYGWPWHYLGDHEDPRHAGERPDLAGKAITPDVLVQAHSASLQITFYPVNKGAAAFPAEYRGDIFAALHGSWNRNSRTGYKIVRLRLKDGKATGEYEDFLTGFVADDRNVWGRPVGVTVARDGALLVTEDGNGTVWRVAYAGR